MVRWEERKEVCAIVGLEIIFFGKEVSLMELKIVFSFFVEWTSEFCVRFWKMIRGDVRIDTISSMGCVNDTTEEI